MDWQWAVRDDRICAEAAGRRARQVASACVTISACERVCDAVLEAFARLEQRHRRRDFALAEIVAEVMRTDAYEESTIRTHVTSRMCRDAPEHHATVYADVERVERGRYRRV